MTQTELDAEIIIIATYGVNLADRCSQARRQGDTQAHKYEQGLMALQNCLAGIRDLDVDDDYLTMSEIEHCVETCYEIFLDCPI
jgi:hypothetical protein